MQCRYFIIIIYCWQFHLIFSWRSFDLSLNDVECFRQSNVTSFLNCSIVRIDEQCQGLLSVSLRFDRDIIKPLLDMVVITERGKTKDNFVLVNVTNINGCDFLEYKGFNLLNIIRKELGTYSNLPSHCPVAKGTEIHVRNFTIDTNALPPYMPETNFHVHIKLWEVKTPTFDLRVHGAITAKKRKLFF